jgi:hypothetical protein
VGAVARDSKRAPEGAVKAEWKQPSSYLEGEGRGTAPPVAVPSLLRRDGAAIDRRDCTRIFGLDKGARKLRARMEGARHGSQSRCELVTAQKDLRLIPDAGLTGRAIHMISREAGHGRKFFQAAKGRDSNEVSFFQTAQTVRAILLARATAALLCP